MGKLEKKLFLTFFQLKLQEKIAKFVLSHQKKVLDKYSSTLEFFLVKICAYFYFGKLILYLIS